MKYLAHLRPPKEVSDQIESYRESFSNYCLSKKSSNIPHITLMALYASEENEPQIIDDLKEISWFSFYLKTGDLDIFDENSLVLKVCENRPLRQLHTEIIESLKKYIDWSENPDKDNFDDDSKKISYAEYGNPHYGQFYSPHITIGKANEDIFDTDKFYKKHKPQGTWTVNEFYLSKKVNGNWRHVEKFESE